MIHDNYNNEDSLIYINGNDDPFGINDVMLKMMEIMVERYDLFSEVDTDEPIVIDFTTLSDDEFGELIREAAVCAELENEWKEHALNRPEKNHYVS